MSSCLELRQYSIQQLEFSGGSVKIDTVFPQNKIKTDGGADKNLIYSVTHVLYLRHLTRRVAINIFDMLEHERMIAHLSKLHNCIHQRFAATFALFTLFRTVSEKYTLGLHVSIEHLKLLMALVPNNVRKRKIVPIKDSLKSGHVTFDDILYFVW